MKKENKQITFIQGGGVATPEGFLAAGIKTGIKSNAAKDMALILSEYPAVTSGAFTTCKVQAAPVIVSKRILEQNKSGIRAVLINSGNANACTGEKGISNVYAEISELTANISDIDENQVLICSTGRIGVQLPMEKIIKGIKQLADSLSKEGSADAAEAIMTTDTKPKSIAVQFNVKGKPVTIGGMAKGAGMIAPALKTLHATMISCITTDAKISPDLLDYTLSKTIDVSFNSITVDGDTSTNDTVFCLANGASGIEIMQGTVGYRRFFNAIKTVTLYLAQELVKDAEGATKFVTVTVKNAKSRCDAKRCAFAIANSLLCKTAWFGADPNWGRIAAAAGYSGANFSPDNMSIFYNDIPVVNNGMDAGTPEEILCNILKQNSFAIVTDLNAGRSSYTVFTNDISYEYVKINAEYHT